MFPGSRGSDNRTPDRLSSEPLQFALAKPTDAALSRVAVGLRQKSTVWCRICPGVFARQDDHRLQNDRVWGCLHLKLGLLKKPKFLTRFCGHSYATLGVHADNGLHGYFLSGASIAPWRRIVKSANRRYSGCVFQVASLLFNSSPFATFEPFRTWCSDVSNGLNGPKTYSPSTRKWRLERVTRLELATSTLGRLHSTTELHPLGSADSTIAFCVDPRGRRGPGTVDGGLHQRRVFVGQRSRFGLIVHADNDVVVRGVRIGKDEHPAAVDEDLDAVG